VIDVRHFILRDVRRGQIHRCEKPGKIVPPLKKLRANLWEAWVPAKRSAVLPVVVKAIRLELNEPAAFLIDEEDAAEAR
jgi:hypothetical protein